MTEQEEFEFRQRAEQEAAAEKEKSVFEKYTGVSEGSPLFGGMVGAIAGIPAGRVIKSASRAVMSPKPGIAPPTTFAPTPAIPSEVVARGPDAVKNWTQTQHAGQFHGGTDYAEAHQRALKVKDALAKTPGYSAVGETGIIAPKEAAAQYEAKQAVAARRARPIGQKIAQAPIVGATQRALQGAAAAIPTWLGRGIAGGSAGFQGVESANKFREGDILGGTISGLGALGSGVALIPHPLTRGIGTAVGVGAPLLNEIIDRIRKQNESASEQQNSEAMPMAHGGLIQGYAGGKKVVKGALDLAVGKEPTIIKDIKNLTTPLWERFGYNPKKVASAYPDIAPPVMKPKEKGEGLYAAKQLSPEAEAVQSARKAAQAEIDRGQYTPFFDITQRSYVNPADYPLTGRTLTDVIPKKAQTIEKYRTIAESPEATARLKAAFAEGSKAPLAKDWYAMKQLEDEFIKELGPEAGRLAFRQRFAEPMAATTGGADPTSNLMMTAYTNYMREKGLPAPTEAYNLPFPIGGRYVSGNMQQANEYHQLGSIPIDNPKRHNFASNFMGYRDRPTIDEQMMGLFVPGKGAPEKGAYGVYESALNKLAKEAGVEPVNFQDVAWAGAKQYQGKPMIEEINQMIHRTSRITGQSPEEVLRGYIRANKPMYGVAGLSVLQGAEGINNPE